MNALSRTITTCLLLALAPLTFADRAATDDEQNITDPRVQHRSYTFPATGETVPYALFVPDSYNESDPAPLIVSLHGLGRSYDWLMGYHGLLDEAEAGGFIVVTPLGYIRRGWYGSRPTDDAQDSQYSEQDVMEVMKLVREQLNVDANRIYLWGHSMGGAGTYHIAASNPDLFAGLGVAAPATPQGTTAKEVLERIKHIPILVLHGDDDQTVPVELTRSWVAEMREIGMQHVYVEIAGGDHSLLISQDAVNMKKFTDFFNIVRKSY
ncbi:MAG: alpha/beta fold hydrolase [Gammaproteobacteria bacterium]|nr:alpha/beta fold hydrolase [Gammaproteobacteria bacterium]